MKVIIRDFNPETDSGCIYTSFATGVYYGGLIDKKQSREDRRKWFAEFHKYLNILLPNSKVYIACLSDNPDMIIGYSIIIGDSLEFVSVKEYYRKQGIGTLLTKNKYKVINEFNLTKIGEQILEAHPELSGEDHGRENGIIDQIEI